MIETPTMFLLGKALEYGASRAMQVNPAKDIVFQERVKLLCANSCSHYRSPTFPPYIDSNFAIRSFITISIFCCSVIIPPTTVLLD